MLQLGTVVSHQSHRVFSATCCRLTSQVSGSARVQTNLFSCTSTLPTCIYPPFPRYRSLYLHPQLPILQTKQITYHLKYVNAPQKTLLQTSNTTSTTSQTTTNKNARQRLRRLFWRKIRHLDHRQHRRWPDQHRRRRRGRRWPRYRRDA